MSNKYQDFINECWQNHDKNSEDVVIKLKENLDLLDSTDKIPGYVSIITHTFGGHLGKWDDARKLLIKITKLNIFENNQAVYRALATLSFCLNEEDQFNKYAEFTTENGSIARVYAVAASELVAQGLILRATEAFEKALASTSSDITKENPAARALAISGNNLACELEEKINRSEEEVKLMLLAATSARKFWQIAGGWTEVERAEYRLAMSYLQAGELSKAIRHARSCESICKDNSADAFESFFAHEALTKINRAICEDLKSKVSKDYQSYCIIP